MEDIKIFIEAHKDDLGGMIHFKAIERAIKLLSPEVKPYGVHTHKAWKEVATGLLALAADKEVSRSARMTAFRIAGQASARCRESMNANNERAKTVEFIQRLKRGDAFFYDGGVHIAPDTNTKDCYPVEYGEVLVYDGQYANVTGRLEDEERDLRSYPLRFQAATADAVIALSVEQVTQNLIDLGINMYELARGLTPEEVEVCDCPNCQARRAAEERGEEKPNIFAEAAASLERGEADEEQDKIEEIIEEALRDLTKSGVRIRIVRVKKDKPGDSKVDITLN